jgi:hypothetical protein
LQQIATTMTELKDTKLNIQEDEIIICELFDRLGRNLPSIIIGYVKSLSFDKICNVKNITIEDIRHFYEFLKPNKNKNKNKKQSHLLSMYHIGCKSRIEDLMWIIETFKVTSDINLMPEYVRFIINGICVNQDISVMTNMFNKLGLTEVIKTDHVARDEFIEIYKYIVENAPLENIKWLEDVCKITETEYSIMGIKRNILSKNNVDVAKWIYCKNGFIIEDRKLIASLLRDICVNNNLEVAEWLSTELNITESDCYDEHNVLILNSICYSSKLETIEWFINKFNITDRVYINFGFMCTCLNTLKVAKWMYSKFQIGKEKIHFDYIISQMIDKGKIDIFEWIYEEFKLDRSIILNSLACCYKSSNYKYTKYIIDKYNINKSEIPMSDCIHHSLFNTKSIKSLAILCEQYNPSREIVINKNNLLLICINGNLAAFKYIHKRYTLEQKDFIIGDDNLINDCFRCGNINVIKWIHKTLNCIGQHKSEYYNTVMLSHIENINHRLLLLEWINKTFP